MFVSLKIDCNMINLLSLCIYREAPLGGSMVRLIYLKSIGDFVCKLFCWEFVQISIAWFYVWK